MKKQNLTLALILCVCLSLTAQVDIESARTQFTNSIQSKGYKTTDIQSFRLTSEHVSSVSGIHHMYFMQEYEDIGIYNAVGSAHFNSSKQLIQTHVSFEDKLAERISSTIPAITAEAAIISAARELKYKYQGTLEVVDELGEKEQKITFRNKTLSLRDIPARLMYQPMENGEIRLAWDVSILEPSQTNWWSMRIDAETGKILHKNNWMVSCNFDHDHASEPSVCDHHEIKNAPASEGSTSMVGGYRVYAMPLQSPADGNRTLETDPDNALASPFGWHDTDGVAGPEFTITRGNNAHAYEDGDNAGFSPNGTAALTFDFAIDTTYSNGTQSEAAAITNLFYWNNVIHDVWYHYGFTEAAGNFQENNYGNGGAGSDYVFAEAQDGSGSCNANFGTPSDGSNPTMQMYVCNDRDGDLDNLVVVHEYGHGISNRLTGGPAAAGCLNNAEQMGEGWSDWLGLMMTIQVGDNGSDPVGVGTWLVGESINGPGIRQYPYSTDMAVNPHTYGDIGSVVAPHGVGSIWCAMLWELTWAMIDRYGFDPDFYSGTGGNNKAMALVIEGMKLQPCSPGFVDGRDAIIRADSILNGEANNCLIWDAFAKRGLGASAVQGSSNSRSDNTEAFDTPAGSPSLVKSVDTVVAMPGDTLTYMFKLKNPSLCNDTLINVVLYDTIPANTIYVSGSASNGGTETGGIVSFPIVANLYPGDSLERSFQVRVDPLYMLPYSFLDDIENGANNWTTTATGSNNWSIVTTNPNSGSSSWYAEDYSTPQDQYLELNNMVTPTNTTQLSFWHSYDTEATWDGGVVQFSINGGVDWLDLGPYMTLNGYNSTIDGSGSNSKPGFSGNSGGYLETRIDLRSFVGQNLNIRFWMSCDASVGGDGWYIDDVSIKSNHITNTVYSTEDGGVNLNGTLVTPTEIQIPQCMDGIQNGDETGVDCGGPSCQPCPSCDDGILNGDEVEVDCGGPDCPACPTCEDGILNGDEEGVDCGGPDCPVCPCMQNDLTLSITVDDYPSETTWELKNSSNVVIESGGPYSGTPSGTTITTDLCVPDGCYQFIIYDTFGDGICCFEGNGSYSLVNNFDTTVLASGGQFTFVDSTDFCVTAPSMGTCDSLLEANGIIAAGTYHAEHILMSDGSVQNPDSVLFKAGAEINLNPNFEVELGAQFSAEIEACMAAMNLVRAKNLKKQAIKEKNLLRKE